MSRAWPAVVSFLALGLLAGCGDKDARRDAAQSGQPVTAPAQQEPRIAAIRWFFGNPPRFALVTAADDGSKQRVLVEAPAGELQRLRSPTWSPDAKQVYFIGVLAEREGDRFVYYESDAYAVSPEGGEPRRITTSRDVEAAVPSPDGRTLLVARIEHPGRRPFTSGLWLLDADGGNERRLLDAEGGKLDRPGSWSPDGSGLRQVAERSSEPAFSPDGRSIAFVSDRDEHGSLRAGEDEDVFANELYVTRADGGNLRRLTRTESLAEAGPAWSPDGTRLAFAREGPAAFQRELMVVKADGGCPTRLIGDASDHSGKTPSFESPAWRPGRLTGDLAPLACD